MLFTLLPPSPCLQLPIPPTSSATTTLEIKNVIPQTPYTITVATVTPAGTSQSAVTSFVADAPGQPPNTISKNWSRTRLESTER